MLTENQYNAAMLRIEHYLKKGSGNLSESEESDLSALSDAAEEYEKVHYPMPLPNA